MACCLMATSHYLNQSWFCKLSWWHHQMETFSVLPAICEGNSPVTGGFLPQRPLMRSFDVLFDLRMNKQLSIQSRRWSFEMSSPSLWRHRNGISETNFSKVLSKIQIFPIKDTSENGICKLTAILLWPWYIIHAHTNKCHLCYDSLLAFK